MLLKNLGKSLVNRSVVLSLALMFVVSGCGQSKPAQSSAAPAASTPAASSAPAAWTPTKPITMVVPGAAGGSTDMMARAVEKVWKKYCPQPVQIVNKGASGGLEGAMEVVKGKADGTIFELGYGGGQDSTMTHLQTVNYDPFKDLIAVARVSVHTIAFAVPADSPFKTAKDVVDWAKKENKPVTASVSQAAGTVDLAMRGFGKLTGIQVTTVPHTGGSQALTTLVGGQTMMGGGHPAEIFSQVKAGRIRVIAMATEERDPVFPDVPTMKEQGVNYSMPGSIKGVAVPVGTPKEIQAYYEDLFKKICSDEEFKKSMMDIYEPVMYQNQADFTKYFKQQYDNYGQLIKSIGIEKTK